MTAVSIEGYLEGAYLTGPPGYLGGIFSELTGTQVELVIEEQENIGMQTNMSVDGPNSLNGMQVKIFPLLHLDHPKYLVEEEPYLTGAYLAGWRCALQGSQVEMNIEQQDPDGVQVDQKIVSPDDDRYEGMQVQMKIVDFENAVGMQTTLIRTHNIGTQVNLVIYNTTQLRLLCDFPSRGLENRYGSDPIDADNANWKTPQLMESGDLGKLQNLNTDVLEQRIQSDTGVVFLELRCDTGATNTFVDTLGILEHNITTSATITVQGSDDENFSTIKFSFNVNPTDPYAIYIAPELPTTPARYYKIVINDNTNPDNYIRIGTIVFGSSDIFSPKECFDNPVSFGRRHFKDEIETEGFTNTSNDRATRRFLGLRFNKLDVEGGNYEKLQDYFEFAKTDLKCLIIPTPTKPTVLTVFSKLVQLPEESHDAIDVTQDEQNVHFATLDLDWDESR